MIVECSACHTRYNVDEKKVPPTGVKVRCRKCQNIIVIKKEVSAPPRQPEQPPHEAPRPTAPTPVEPQIPSEPTLPAGLSDEDKQWHERARRLAKALASDLVLYNQDKVDKGLREGTLVQLLGAEIRRSWDYYCQQIPKRIVDTTDYFKEQLNKIVGKGKEIFK